MQLVLQTLQYCQKKLNSFFVHENKKQASKVAHNLFFTVLYCPAAQTSPELIFHSYKYVPRLNRLLGWRYL